MAFHETYSSFQRLRDERPAWKLLAAHSGPFMLAVMSEWFEEGNPEVSVDRARVYLESRIRDTRTEEEAGDPAQTARSWLNQWVDAGYLREQNQKYIMTAATQTAMQFAVGLVHREMSATASSLENVSSAFRRLVVDLSPDIEERKALLQEQIDNLNREMAALDASGVRVLSPERKREGVRTVYGLAMRLTQDFRFLEDELRRNENTIQQRILDDEESRGGVLISVMDAEDALNGSPAGQAFNGFYDLLSNDERAEEFRAQIKRLLALGAGEFLSADESMQLMHLVRNLLSESERVLSRRGAGVDRLRAYIQSGAAVEHREMDRLLRRAAQYALKLQDNKEISWHDDMSIMMRTGKVRFSSPASLAVKMPDEVRMVANLDESETPVRVSDGAIEKLSRFRFTRVVERTWEALCRMGPRTLGELAIENPIRGGVEEVLALVRIAQSTRAQCLGGDEWIYFTDNDKKLLRAKVPTMLLLPDNFPEDLREV